MLIFLANEIRPDIFKGVQLEGVALSIIKKRQLLTCQNKVITDLTMSLVIICSRQSALGSKCLPLAKIVAFKIMHRCKWGNDHPR